MHDYDFLTKVCTDIVHFETKSSRCSTYGSPVFVKEAKFSLAQDEERNFDAISEHAEENGLDVDDGSNDGMRGDASSLDNRKNSHVAKL